MLLTLWLAGRNLDTPALHQWFLYSANLLAQICERIFLAKFRISHCGLSSANSGDDCLSKSKTQGSNLNSFGIRLILLFA